MSNKVFLSIATSENPEHKVYEEKLVELFQNNSFELVKCTNRDLYNPLAPIHEILKDCIGCVILLLERYYIQSGFEKRGSSLEKQLSEKALTTPWCHIEAGMAYTLGLPLLILREKTVYQDGVFDVNIKAFPQVEIDINDFDEWNLDKPKYILDKYFLDLSKSLPFVFSKKPSPILDSTNTKKVINAFISYASEDRDLMELISQGLKQHLSHSIDYIYKIWDDRQIVLGENWKVEINNQINESSLCILLVSASFAASTFIKEIELAQFLEKKSNEKIVFVPVLVRSYDFKQFEEISKLQFFKPYYSQYGYNKPIDRMKIMPFDVLGDDDKVTAKQLTDYYKNLAQKISEAVRAKF